MSSSPQEEDYLDQLNRVFPWHRPFTANEQIIIVLFVAAVVSIIGCTLLCLICSRSPLRRRYYAKKKLDKERRILIPATSKQDTLVLPSTPPYYESIVKTDDMTIFNKLSKCQYLNFGRKLSNGTVSDTDCAQSSTSTDHASSLSGKITRTQSTRSSFSNGDTLVTTITTYPSPPYAQVNVELNIDTTKNILAIHLTNGQHFSLHPAFDEQAEFFIHVQLLNNKILKKFHDSRTKCRSSLQLSTWKKQQEKTTKKLSRTSSDTLLCHEYLLFEFNKDSIKSTSLRFLLFCIDRSGIHDLMFEAVIPLNSSMIPHYQQIIEFKNLPEITFGEILLGMSYLPTAERFTIKVEKLRYLCKIEKDKKIDARLIVTFFHHGRRFFQKKISSIISDESLTTKTNVHEINEIIMQNIPQHDIQSIYVHFELIIRILHSKDESIISGGSILLGEHTQYGNEWLKMLEQPRQIHLGWYQFYG
ncbi:unnamed protein product [Rotaria sp. Silwood2]|nr:unnamed protein product [Rotaria sp. Silwood2]CAF2743044.1 unnamed protein product [Rotaria sp. Silwood2]CAF3989240.1 unnamed protein product [Rotaria sp. Silwood2]CAF4244952.1 unnamed protein product [Rotaria sp. Silwood2]